MLLSQRGATVSVTNSRLRLVEMAQRADHREMAFDAIVIDSSMTTSDRHDVLIQLAGKGTTHGRIIVMVSADNLSGETSRLEHVGFCNYIVKPVKRGELLAAIAGATGSREGSNHAAAARPREIKAARPGTARASRSLRGRDFAVCRT